MKSTIIVDIKNKHDESYIISKLSSLENKFNVFISLTPYSSYLLNKKNIKYKTFHDLCGVEEFRDKVLEKFYNIELSIKMFPDTSYILRVIMQVLTYEMYIKILNNYINQDNMNIIYITDTSKIEINIDNLFNNNLSLIHFNSNINEIININKKDTIFYKKNLLIQKMSRILYTKDLFFKIKNKLIMKENTSYENVYFSKYINNDNSLELKRKDINIKDFKFKLQEILMPDNNFCILYESIIDNFEFDIINHVPSCDNNFFSYLSNNKKYIESSTLKANNIPVIFTQHGSYLYNHFFYKYCEILPATINLVLNDFTKLMFESKSEKKVYTIGSITFNQTIKERKKKYDYLYITYNTNYSGNINHIESFDCLHSMDANIIFQKHKLIIKLFGTKFKDKKICIKIQPGIFMGNMLYIPFLELSKKYKNVTIEFKTPISTLIEKSKYIISDYFSSEFINRELHYKRDIILFQGSPLPLPIETIEDMKKMFILVDTVDDLEDKVNNIEEITKDRKRYDDIIEYYSSKKCDTKKVVTEILEKEFNEGR